MVRTLKTNSNSYSSWTYEIAVYNCDLSKVRCCFLVRIEGLPRTFWKRDLICDSDKSSNRFWSSNFILRLLKSESDFVFPIRTPSDFGLCQIVHLKRIPKLRGPSRFFIRTFLDPKTQILFWLFEGSSPRQILFAGFFIEFNLFKLAFF